MHSLARRACFNLPIFAVFCFSIACCLPFHAAAEDIPATKTHEPVPDNNAPKEIKQLIADGKVKVVYDSDPEFVKAQRGWADFQIRLTQTFKFNVTMPQKNNRRRIRIIVNKLEPKIELTHLIRLPSTFKSPDIWESQILRHEFDHVAISLDPRPLLLLRHLLEHLPAIERTLELQEEPTNERINQIINEEAERRHAALIELMRQNNQLLDKVGAHGGQPVPQRAAFFAKLYTKEHLAERKFEFIEQALKLLESPAYQHAELRFLPRDPTQATKP